MLTNGNRTFVLCTPLVLFALLTALAVAQGKTDAALSVEDIVQRLSDRNHKRARDLRNCTCRRVYSLAYRGFPGNRDASLTVLARFDAPDRKEFEIISQSGSKFIINRVFKKLLAAEKEALSDTLRRQNALTWDNYQFTFSALEQTPAGACYVLNLEPKTNNKFVYRGKIWIDANDFAVRRIEAEPAKNPSFWIRRTKISHMYSKIGEFWLPSRNTSVANIRLGGTAALTIQYDDCHVNDGQNAAFPTAPLAANR
jgi:hypothetical protein